MDVSLRRLEAGHKGLGSQWLGEQLLRLVLEQGEGRAAALLTAGRAGAGRGHGHLPLAGVAVRAGQKDGHQDLARGLAAGAGALHLP